MTNIVVVYATREGQTEKIARHIAGVLEQSGHRVELLDAERPTPPLDPARFDLAFVGAPIHARGYPRSVARFVRAQLEFLRLVPSAFFSVGLAVASRRSDGRAQTMPLVQAFLDKTGWRPHRVELVAGALAYSKYNLLIRFVMRRIAAKKAATPIRRGITNTRTGAPSIGSRWSSRPLRGVRRRRRRPSARLRSVRRGQRARQAQTSAPGIGPKSGPADGLSPPRANELSASAEKKYTLASSGRESGWLPPPRSCPERSRAVVPQRGADRRLAHLPSAR